MSGEKDKPKDEMTKEEIEKLGLPQETIIQDTEVNPSFFGDTPNIMGVQLLKAGFIFVRKVILIDAIYEYSFKTKRTYFKITMLDDENHDQLTQRFELEGQEAKDLISFLDSYTTKDMPVVHFTVKFGVPMDARKKE